jgi:hypothetical protein
MLNESGVTPMDIGTFDATDGKGKKGKGKEKGKKYGKGKDVKGKSGNVKGKTKDSDNKFDGTCNTWQMYGRRYRDCRKPGGGAYKQTGVNAAGTEDQQQSAKVDEDKNDEGQVRTGLAAMSAVTNYSMTDAWILAAGSYENDHFSWQLEIDSGAGEHVCRRDFRDDIPISEPSMHNLYDVQGREIRIWYMDCSTCSAYYERFIDECQYYF